MRRGGWVAGAAVVLALASGSHTAIAAADCEGLSADLSNSGAVVAASVRRNSSGTTPRFLVAGIGAEGRIGPWVSKVSYQLLGTPGLDPGQVRITLHTRNFSRDVSDEFHIAEQGSLLIMRTELVRDLAIGTRETVDGGTLAFSFSDANYESNWKFEHVLHRDTQCEAATPESSAAVGARAGTS